MLGRLAQHESWARPTMRPKSFSLRVRKMGATKTPLCSVTGRKPPLNDNHWERRQAVARGGERVNAESWPEERAKSW